MEKQSYAAPTISTIGTLVDLTRQGTIDKCGGSGDLKLPLLLDNKFAVDCPE